MIVFAGCTWVPDLPAPVPPWSCAAITDVQPHTWRVFLWLGSIPPGSCPPTFRLENLILHSVTLSLELGTVTQSSSHRDLWCELAPCHYFQFFPDVCSRLDQVYISLLLWVSRLSPLRVASVTIWEGLCHLPCGSPALISWPYPLTEGPRFITGWGLVAT